MTMQIDNNPVYEEIDLRRYVKTLISHIRWIIGAAVLCAVIALIVSLIMPRTYAATALVSVTEPRYILQFDPRLATSQEVALPSKAYPELALSDGVLGLVLADTTAMAEAFESVAELRDTLDATSATDPGLIQLMATARSPEAAQALANAWARAFVARADEIYGQGEKQAVFFAAQLAQAEADLDAAETALIAYQAQNDETILKNRLASETQTQADYLTAHRHATYLIQDMRNLRAQLAEQPRSYKVSLADQMTALFLQIKAFNAEASTPLQIQIDAADTLPDMTTAEQIALLDDIIAILETHAEAMTARLSEVEPRILTLQQQLQEQQVAGERLTRTRNLAQEAEITLARKVQESRIAAEGNGDTVVIASQAFLPTRPSNPSKLVVTGVAGVLGGALAVLAVLGLAWWRDENGNIDHPA